MKRKSWNLRAYERCYENLWQWKFLTYMKVILLKFSNKWGYRVPTDHLFSTKGSSSTETVVHSTELLAFSIANHFSPSMKSMCHSLKHLYVYQSPLYLHYHLFNSYVCMYVIHLYVGSRCGHMDLDGALDHCQAPWIPHVYCLARACAVRLHAWAACQAGLFLVIRTCQPICEHGSQGPQWRS